jgi:putative redox protein
MRKGKGWFLKNVEVRLSHRNIPMKNCEGGDTKSIMIEEIESQILLQGDLDETARNRLFEIAVRCPVHRTLSSNLQIRSELIKKDIIEF